MTEKFTTTGRLSRVDTKFAFISTSMGSVFCPLAAAIPTDEHVPDLSVRYNVGDIVQVTMVAQNGKNNCNWRAIKVRRVTKFPSEDLPSKAIYPVYFDKVVAVSSVYETLAFARNDEMGDVFVPGAAFSSEEVSRLNSYLIPGDRLLVSVRSQEEVNGCKWIAISATKLNKLTEKSITGWGKILSLTDISATVWSMEYGEIKCSLLTWIGGDAGKSAEGLSEILKIGDEVLFTAVCRNGILRSIRWTARGFNSGNERVTFADSFTQTALSVSQMVINAMEDSELLGCAFAQKPTLLRLLKSSM